MLLLFSNILILLASAACAMISPAYYPDWHLLLLLAGVQLILCLRFGSRPGWLSVLAVMMTR